MIDPLSENVISLATAAKSLPTRRGDRLAERVASIAGPSRVAEASFWRRCKSGALAARRRALARFFARLDPSGRHRTACSPADGQAA